jgi:hypothetical protein
MEKEIPWTDRWLNEKEVSEIIGCNIQTLRNRRYRRVGISYTKDGSNVRYFGQDVLDYMESRKVDWS